MSPSDVYCLWLEREREIKGPSGFIIFQDIRNKIVNSATRTLKYHFVRAAVYTCVRGHNVSDIVDTVLLLLLLCFVLLFIQSIHPSLQCSSRSLIHASLCDFFLKLVFFF